MTTIMLRLDWLLDRRETRSSAFLKKILMARFVKSETRFYQTSSVGLHCTSRKGDIDNESYVIRMTIN